MDNRILKLESYSVNLEAVQKFLADIIVNKFEDVINHSLGSEDMLLRLTVLLEIKVPTPAQVQGIIGTAMWVINNRHVLPLAWLSVIRDRYLELINEENNAFRSESLLEELQRIDYQIEHQLPFPMFIEVLLAPEVMIDVYINERNTRGIE